MPRIADRQPSGRRSILAGAAGKHCIGLSIILTVLPLVHPVGTLAQEVPERRFSTEEWLEDLEFAANTITSFHPHPFYRVSEENFQSALSGARNTIRNARTDYEAYFAIRRVFAKIQDGHTQLTDQGAWDFLDLRFPFRVDQFTDGIFITVIDKNHEGFLGSRVTGIDGMPVEEVLERILQITNVDNKFGRVRPVLTSLTFARILFGLGIGQSLSEIHLQVEKPSGGSEILSLKARHDESPIIWSNRVNLGPTEGEYVQAASVLGPGAPLHLRKQGPEVEYYWFGHLPAEKAVYFQLNQVANQPNGGETLSDFTERIWTYIDENEEEVEKLIIDLRYNDGGVARRIIPFVNEIIKRDSLNKRGKLFLLVGKRTYSAAVIFLTEMVVHTNVIVVGDPPACPFNFFSDWINRGELPNTGFGLMIASRQVDNSWSDDTVFYPPEVPAPFSSHAYFSGQDPALEAALAWKPNVLND